MPTERDPEFTEMDLRPYFEFVRRNSKIIAAIMAVFIAAGGLLSLLSPRSWTATSTVAVPPPPAATQTQVIGGIQIAWPTVIYSQETYARLLTSGTLLRMVINRLHLPLEQQTLARIQARPIPNTLLIAITVTGPDKQQTENIANALAASLVEYDRQGVASELTQGRQFVANQLVNAKVELQRRENALNQFNERENLAALQAELNQQLSTLTGARQTYEQNKIDLGVTQERLAKVEQELASPQDNNAIRGQLDGQKATLEVEVAGLQAKDRLLSSAVRQAEQRVNALNVRLTEKNAQLTQLNRALDTAKSVFTTLTARATDAIIAESMKQGFVRVADLAQARPKSKGTASRIILSALLGFVAGVLGAFALDRFRLATLFAADIGAPAGRRGDAPQIARPG